MKSLQVENQLLMSVSMTSEIGTHKYCLPYSSSTKLGPDVNSIAELNATLKKLKCVFQT